MSKTPLELVEELAEARRKKEDQAEQHQVEDLERRQQKLEKRWGPVAALLKEAAARYPQVVEAGHDPHRDALYFRLGHRASSAFVDSWPFRLFGTVRGGHEWAVFRGAHGEQTYKDFPTRDELLIWLVYALSQYIPATSKKAEEKTKS